MAYKIYQKLQSGMADQGLIDATDVDFTENGQTKKLSQVVEGIASEVGGKIGNLTNLNDGIKEKDPDTVIDAINAVHDIATGYDLYEDFVEAYEAAEGTEANPGTSSRWAKFLSAQEKRGSDFETAQAQRDTRFSSQISTLRSTYLPQTATSLPDGGLVDDNTYYQLGEQSSIEINGLWDETDEEWLITDGVIIEFTAHPTSGCSISFEKEMYFVNTGGASAITIEKGRKYQLLIAYNNVSVIPLDKLTIQ